MIEADLRSLLHILKKIIDNTTSLVDLMRIKMLYHPPITIWGRVLLSKPTNTHELTMPTALI
jgi:hypothetical protein